MQETFRALIVEMGGDGRRRRCRRKEQGYGIADGGTIIHELGGVRMGSDPTDVVVNANCQAHDVKNLFVADGGPFVSQADKNPTWTILALSWRTSDYIAEQRKAGAAMSDASKPRREVGRRRIAAATAGAFVMPSAAARDRSQRRIDAARRRAQQPVPRTRRSSSPRTSGRRCACSSTTSFRGTSKSGTATDASVPEYMDFDARPRGRTNAQSRCAAGSRGSITECRKRFEKNFVDVHRRAAAPVLDDIAYPAKAKPEMSYGV